MWIRKPAEEIAAIERIKDKQRRSVRRPLIESFTVTTVSIALYVAFGHIVFVRRPLDLTSGWDIVKIVVVWVVLFVLFFVWQYRNQRKYGSRSWLGEENAMHCPECHEASQKTESGLCPCGGTLEPFEYWRWDDEDE